MAKLEPKIVFDQFAQINKIPRPSKHEEKMIEYLKDFGKSHGLETVVDETGNVLIKKPATKGYEDRPTVVLQSHMDMVCDKLVDVDFDFYNDPIQTYVDGDWLRAKGTTLGADDGIGDAIELAILASDDIEHGPIECVFTRDEETELSGAIGMKSDFMSGKYLINLDSEDEGEIFISCAGGCGTEATFNFAREDAPAGYDFILLSLKGLNGGHSGDDIEKKRANAIKILARFLYIEQDKLDLRLASFDSGKMHNAIPRDGKVVAAVPGGMVEQVRKDWEKFQADVKNEYFVTDTNMQFALSSAPAEQVLPREQGRNIVMALQAVDNGVYAMSQAEEISWLVETSSNVSVVETGTDYLKVISLQRSSVNSNLLNMCNTVEAAFRLAGAYNIVHNEANPAWPMKPGSKLVEIAKESYERLFHKEPKVIGIHAGLECGLFAERYPDMDMISFGPTLRNVHTPDECLYIPTVKLVWDHLLDILKHIK
ncbi:MAG: aminoacyl-histidine dipeptidase [Sodaliphilus pleomorphus]|uniref:aminoacyl-histidine dipeptidase n=1 Tax=Sodaliphilus pleomorphus TaxID=2606626 RepID=UPI0023F4DB79|nr:aminoacyl-histidine dipeptidase [Sodaliphilus pleomorphus]MCI5979905.1 aminoacyl-histidine dipeptidase [Muribaculaceae bacterium]MCI6169367.1 aminoacyl-histidine dipeptidase [Muribaculaceae bacterium]MDD6474420.1 aminoacyl-histidine dipeptidase [Sodaliphilus pleomorphus]MDD6686376.1 aminoacyl-histidine dipeptidase [Sodaliphilus pleomorphus]MDD7066345.1 aminoacyl-histidine dipeptidase [Sodaliphilus pleomorphus]